MPGTAGSGWFRLLTIRGCWAHSEIDPDIRHQVQDPDRVQVGSGDARHTARSILTIRTHGWLRRIRLLSGFRHLSGAYQHIYVHISSVTHYLCVCV